MGMPGSRAHTPLPVSEASLGLAGISEHLDEVQHIAEDGALLASVRLGPVLVAVGGQGFETGAQQVHVLVEELLLCGRERGWGGDEQPAWNSPHSWKPGREQGLAMAGVLGGS